MTLKTNTVFDIADIFQQLYGYKPAHVPGMPNSFPTQSPATVQSIYKKTTNMYGTPLYSQSDLMGREVFCPITIGGFDLFGKPKDYLFPFAVMGFSRTKTIVSTEMTETGGEVDEIISNRSWQISIKGFIIGEYEQFPDEGLKMLNDVFAHNNTVRLMSAISDIFLYDNDSILLTELEIPAKPKVIGVRDFQFKAKSSNIFTLYQS